MKKEKFTKEQKKEYFKTLRDRWNKSKELADNNEVMKALYAEQPEGISYYSFAFTFQQMEAQNLKGVPYIDTKTFKKWKEAGFTVKKGSKSTLSGITWLKSKNSDDDDDEFLFPKEYNLFHSTQVEKIN